MSCRERMIVEDEIIEADRRLQTLQVGTQQHNDVLLKLRTFRALRDRFDDFDPLDPSVPMGQLSEPASRLPAGVIEERQWFHAKLRALLMCVQDEEYRDAKLIYEMLLRAATVK